MFKVCSPPIASPEGLILNRYQVHMDHICPQWTLFSQRQVEPSILLSTHLSRQPTLVENFLVHQPRLRCPLVLRINFRLRVSMCPADFLLGEKLLEISKSSTLNPRGMSCCSQLAGLHAYYLQCHFRLCLAWTPGCLTRRSQYVEETEDRSYCYLFYRSSVSLVCFGTIDL